MICMVIATFGGGASRAWVSSQVSALLVGDIYELCTTFASMNINFAKKYKSFNISIA